MNHSSEGSWGANSPLKIFRKRGAKDPFAGRPPPKSVSIAVIARNEEANIERVLKNAAPYCDELIVIDGRSTDRTAELAKECGAIVYQDEGVGKGKAIREAIRRVKSDIIVFMDADWSHDPHDVPKLVGPILDNKADHVVASRMLGGSDELYGTFQLFLRLVGNAIITLGINYRFGVTITDSQNGFRAIRTDLARELNLKEIITTIEQELTIKTLRAGARIAEIQSHEYARYHGDSCIKLRKVWLRYIYSWLKCLILP